MAGGLDSAQHGCGGADLGNLVSPGARLGERPVVQADLLVLVGDLLVEDDLEERRVRARQEIPLDGLLLLLDGLVLLLALASPLTLPHGVPSPVNDQDIDGRRQPGPDRATTRRHPQV